MKWIFAFLLFIPTLAIGQYHIRVECYYNPSENKEEMYQYYNIAFTNDNWKTKENINSTWDASDNIQPYDVCYQLRLFDGEKEAAIEFAKHFTSYKKCISYNDVIRGRWMKLVAYRKAHPIYVPKAIPIKKHCCTITQVY